MKNPVELTEHSREVAAAVDAIQRALGVNVLAVVLVDTDGLVSAIPNPNLDPAVVFRGLAGQNWETAARIAEEFIP